MDHIKSQIDSLPELNDEQITALEASIIAQFDEFAEADRTVESVDAMGELADMLDSVRGEVVRREAQAEELEARASEAANRVHGGPDEETEEVPAEAPEDDEDEDDVPVTASADEAEVVADETPEISETEASVEETVDEPAVEAEASVEEEVAAPEEASVEEVAEVEAPAEAEAAVEEVVEETTADTEAAVEETVAEVEAPAEAEASNSDETTIEQIAQEEALTVTASAEESVTPPADRAVDLQVTEAPVAIVAGADIPGYSAGQTIENAAGIAKAFTERLHTLRRANGGDGEQHTVASIRTEYSEARTLVAGAADANSDKIAAAREEMAALVASGGYGTPTPQTYEIFGFGTDARPVKDSLPKFQADRGSISYIEPPALSGYNGMNYANASGVWTPAMDVDAANNDVSGTDVVKNVLVVKGAITRFAEVDAITLQLQIGNLLSRAYPELVERHNELALIQHARLAEKTILAKIDAGSTPVTAGGGANATGVARDFLVTVRRAATQYRSRHRLSLETPLEAIIPNWVIDAIAADLVLQMPGDATLDTAKAEITGYLRALNVSFVASYDLNEFGAQGSGALAAWGTTFKWYLFSEGTWLFLDGGTLDLGIVRDSTLVGTNDYRMFVESFEGVAKVGIESLAITQTFKVTGEAAALIDTSA